MNLPFDESDLTYEILQDGPIPTGAGAPDGGESGGPNPMILFGIIIVLFYVVMIGPERKQRKKREEMLAAVKKGDEVMLTSGIYGTIANLGDDTVKVQVSDGVRIKVARSSIQTVVGLEDKELVPQKKSSDKADEKSDAKEDAAAEAKA